MAFERLAAQARAGRERRQARRAARQAGRGGGARVGAGGGGGGTDDTLALTEGIPEAPTAEFTRTGMPRADSNEVENVQGHMRGATLVQLGRDVPEAIETAERERVAAAEEDQARSEEFGKDVEADTAETIAKIDAESMSLEEDADRIQESIANQAEALKEIPEEIRTEFEDLRGQLATQQGEALGRIDTKETAALSQVMEGRNSAMLAAVQGIQGNVSNQVASIQSNPNLTDAQKAGMVAQIRMSGASAMAPAIGQTILGFNQLSADVATKFGAISGTIEQTGLTTSATLMGQQGTAFAQAQVAVGEMTNELINIDATSSAAFAQSQTQLLATRSQAQMQSNDILLRNLPLQDTPYLDLAEAASARINIADQLQDKDFIRGLQTEAMELQKAYFEDMVGTPQRNFLDNAWQFVTRFGFGF